MVLFIFIATVSSAPVPADHAKIRIHVPVKHHTHFITKTLVKKILVPVKEPKKKHHSHRHYQEDDEDDWLDREDRGSRGGYHYPSPKKKKFHPFI
uniref:Putative conserved secreted protein n=2 Tax=Lutzomyia longipalpis TaxID=7200 RepID=A0A1B0CPW8_LUTLO